jgi:hypothetical protein
MSRPKPDELEAMAAHIADRSPQLASLLRMASHAQKIDPRRLIADLGAHALDTLIGKARERAAEEIEAWAHNTANKPEASPKPRASTRKGITKHGK